jgi:hypothetical protein
MNPIHDLERFISSTILIELVIQPLLEILIVVCGDTLPMIEIVPDEVMMSVNDRIFHVYSSNDDNWINNVVFFGHCRILISG